MRLAPAKEEGWMTAAGRERNFMQMPHRLSKYNTGNWKKPPEIGKKRKKRRFRLAFFQK
jgi:hypothetical protein